MTLYCLVKRYMDSLDRTATKPRMARKAINRFFYRGGKENLKRNTARKATGSQMNGAGEREWAFESLGFCGNGGCEENSSLQVWSNFENYSFSHHFLI